MFDTLEEIRRQFDVGEDSFAEFKDVRVVGRSVRSPNADQFAGELVAFANAEGGVVFLGVDDDGVVQGIPREVMDLVEQWAVNVASNNCDPPIRPVIRKLRLPVGEEDERDVLLVEVHRGLYVHRTTSGRWFVRVGSTKRDLTSPELARLLQERGRAFVFDEQSVFDAAVEDLDEDALDRFFGSDTELPRSDLLRNTRVVTPGPESDIHPTVAGLLVFGRHPQTYLPSARIDAAVYRGVELHSDALVHAASIKDSVDRQIDEAMRFVDRFMLRPARKDAGRTDFPQYDLSAVHEAVVNAVAHRDYSLSGAKIRLFLFADRLELYSPGALPNTMSLESLPYRVFTRNQLLVSFLSRLRSERTGRAYLESRGEGVRTILGASERHSGRRPQYDLLGQELRLTIWALPSPHGILNEEK